MAAADANIQFDIREKLRLFKSPIVKRDNEKHSRHHTADGDNGSEDLNVLGDRDTPELIRHDDVSILELFFDLFFAANYTVFAQNQAVTNHARFKAYVGYFCLLWLTWFVVTLYDVRFVTDSIFERITRAVQLGVMVSAAVVAPSFDPTNQNMKTMKTMAVILCVSRAVLAIEYTSVLWHARRYKKTRLPLYLQIGINVAAAAVYFGMTFRFHHTRSRIFITWYIIAGVEAILSIGISNFWPILSFTKTHLMKRMSLLTVMILGDGIITVAQNVVSIVKRPAAWNATTIGVVTAGTATIYFIFLIYFDWMKTSYLPPWRQQLWTCLHLPFNLSLVIFMAGFTQFIIWSKIVNTIGNLGEDWILGDFSALANATSLDVQRNMTRVTNDYFAVYPPKYFDTWNVVNLALDNITTIPDEFWAQAYNEFGNLSASLEPAAEMLDNVLDVLLASMTNALFEAFNIDLTPEVTNAAANSTNSNQVGNVQIQVNQKTWGRYRLVFAYGYIACGCTLMLLTLLTIVSRITPWKPWPIIRAIIFTLLAIGTGLVALLFYHPNQDIKFLFSPWVLPTITFVWLIVLILTHIGNSRTLFSSSSASSSSKGIGSGARALFGRQSPYVPVDVPMGPWKSGSSERGESPVTFNDGEVNAATVRQRMMAPTYNETGTDESDYGYVGAQQYGVARSTSPETVYSPPHPSTAYQGAKRY